MKINLDTGTMFSRPTLQLLLFLILIGFATGCAVSGLPSGEQYKAIQAGKRAVVLLRVTAELKDGTEVTAFLNDRLDFGKTLCGLPCGANIGDNISLGLGSFDTGGEVRRTSHLYFSAKTHRQGWIYFILEPGIYYLAVQGGRSTELTTYERELLSLPRWRIDIPTGSPITYAGTLHLKCQSAWNIMGTKNCIAIDAMAIRNEEALAKTISTEYLLDLGPPQTILMQRHSGPIILRTPK